MISFTTSELANILNAKLIGRSERTIKSISIDSRSIVGGENVLFIALVGQNHDGHKYIKDLYNYQALKVERQDGK